MPKVFISHSNQDSQPTQRIVEALRQANFDVWVDFENIRGGADWLCEIEAGIQRCDAVVVVLSAQSAASVWVERECLYAFQLQKPVITALVADILIPLHLINIQYVDLRRGASAGVAKLLAALQAWTDVDDYPIAAVSRQPAETNFFPYLEQLPEGETAALVARDLYVWAGAVADGLSFSGAVQPGFQARVGLPRGLATVLTIRAYRRSPAAQIPLDALARYPPLDQAGVRRDFLERLNRILPASARLPADRAQRRPSFALRHLDRAEALEGFKALMLDLIEGLRESDRAT